MRVFNWLLRAFVFFALFAFALNNQQTVIVHWFFGVDWSAPLVIVVLIAFGCGCAAGVIGMLPMWWRQKRSAQPGAGSPGPTSAVDTPAPPSSAPGPAANNLSAPPPSEFGV